jgi:hypothetical protein
MQKLYNVSLLAKHYCIYNYHHAIYEGEFPIVPALDPICNPLPPVSSTCVRKLPQEELSFSPSPSPAVWPVEAGAKAPLLYRGMIIYVETIYVCT